MINLPIPKITISEILDKNVFYRLKVQFNQFDMHYNPEYPRHMIEDINYMVLEYSYKDQGVDSNTGMSLQEEILNHKHEVVLNLYEDYIYPILEGILEAEIGRIEYRRIKETKYSDSEKKGFYNELETEYKQYLDKVESSHYLNDKGKDIIRETILELTDYLDNKIDGPIELKKISFTLGSENLAIIFARLLKYGYITGVNPRELGMLMSKYFLHGTNKNVPPEIRNKINKYQKGSSFSEKKKDELTSLFKNIFSY